MAGIPCRDVLVVVPVKDLAGTKSRLAPILDPDARAGLTIYMMRRVVGAARSAGVGEVCVVSPDVVVLAEAESVGATAVMQRGRGLNAALESEGLSFAAGRAAAAMLVLPADLPLLEPEDVAGVLERAADRQVVISPDGSRTGTNALLLAPPDAMGGFRFGIGSFDLHREAAREAGVSVVEYENAHLAFDLDTGLDLARLGRLEPGGATRRRA
ncbi:2-phospho-L-lactate guanylyltransferase [Rubrobacter indicoceani]|uniref:2-phospho-L-lactate guanylyltransferase n=1 Tax=Rubrobacter indicoceani TaxID=2051957 RepID=UPI000E5B7FF4|nr:2-phospho-L-lactate guanylyltransferase [Rubrobacter indicoceani]